MTSSEDLIRLRQLVAADTALYDGLDRHCLRIQDVDRFDVWTDCPPRIGEPFADDGGEAEFCHLGNGAVIVYVPLADRPYVVVGRDVREFLGLLLRSNGVLDGLGYDFEREVEELERIDADADFWTPQSRAAMGRLVDEFGLRVWDDVRGRLTELQDLLPSGQA